jgi:membrane-bound lytic murein transglycosylase D
MRARRINNQLMLMRLFATFTLMLLLTACASTTDKKQRVPSAAQSEVVSSTRQTQENYQLSRHRTPALPISKTTQNADLWLRLRQGFELPELKNKRVAYYEKHFTKNPAQFYTMLERAKWFLPYILSEVEKRNYPSEIALLPAVESAYITDAKSRSSASGLWQFIPSTGKLYNLRQDWWYDGRRDPVLSTQAALKFLGELEQRFDSDWFHAIAAYNAGGWTIEKSIRKNSSEGKSTHFNQLSLRRETRDYVPKLIAFRNIFRNPHKFGITLPAISSKQQFARLDVGSQLDLALFANKSGIDSRTVRFLNSAYLRNITPPNGPHIITLPARSLSKAKSTLASLPRNDRLRWAHYRVKQGDVMSRIANRYGVSTVSIRQSNQLSSNLIRTGQILLIPVIPGQAAKLNTSPARNANANANSNSNSRLTHHVRKGDTLWGIAQRYGVKISQISQWNKLEQTRPLKLGQKLTIYTHS